MQLLEEGLLHLSRRNLILNFTGYQNIFLRSKDELC